MNLTILGTTYPPTQTDRCGHTWEFKYDDVFTGQVSSFSDGVLWELRFMEKRIAHGAEGSPKAAATAVARAAKAFALKIQALTEAPSEMPVRTVWDRLMED